MINVFYRLSDSGYKKEKPDYIDNYSCLDNFITKFWLNYEINMIVICDNVADKTFELLKNTYLGPNYLRTYFGNGAQSFNYALTMALELTDDEIVYFVENDYLHKEHSDQIIIEGFELGADYVTLYDHPDKYIDGPNPFVENGGEVTKVFLSKNCHWKLTNSTTMTFAAKVKTLKEDEDIIRKFTVGTHPYDFQMFLALRDKGRSLVSPIPGFSTHGEKAWLCPLTDWSKI